jgi:hypothetical protein
LPLSMTSSAQQKFQGREENLWEALWHVVRKREARLSGFEL